jgi:hypothetical protein
MMKLPGVTLRGMCTVPLRIRSAWGIALSCRFPGCKHTEVEFKLKTTKSAKNFISEIGTKLPKGVKPDGLPSQLTQQIPQRLCENERPNSSCECNDRQDRRHHCGNAAANDGPEIA